MMRQLAGVLGLVVAVASGAAQLSAGQEKGKAAPAKGTGYSVEFTFGEERYAGAMMLQFVKGTVKGSMDIDTPSRVTGEVAGTLKGNALVLDYPYTMDNCTGRVQVEATMAAKRAGASGKAIASGCSDMPIEGTVTLKRK